MNKKILAAAVAAAMVAPAAALANDVTVYGIGHVSVNYIDSDSQARDGWDVVSNASRLGFKGTEDLANGLKAIWKMEFGIDMADSGQCGVSEGLLGSPTVGQGNVVGRCTDQSSNLVTARNAYVGLAGGWGTFLVGRHDTPMKMSTGKLDLFSDQLGDYNSTVNITDIRTSSAIAYVSPSWTGFSFAAATVAPHIYYPNVDGTTGDYDSDDLAGAYSLAITWDGPMGFFASAAYEVLTQDWLEAWAGQALNIVDPGNVLTNDDEKWRFGLGWTGAGFTLGGVYENAQNVLGFQQDKTSWQVSAGYTFGNNMIKAMYGQVDWHGDGLLDENDVDSWAIGWDHNLSKRTTVYLQYVDKNADIDITDVTGGSIGIIHKF